MLGSDRYVVLNAVFHVLEFVHYFLKNSQVCFVSFFLKLLFLFLYELVYHVVSFLLLILLLGHLRLRVRDAVRFRSVTHLDIVDFVVF